MKKILSEMPPKVIEGKETTTEDLKKQIAWYQTALYQELERQMQVNNSFTDEIMVQVSVTCVVCCVLCVFSAFKRVLLYDFVIRFMAWVLCGVVCTCVLYVWL